MDQRKCVYSYSIPDFCVCVYGYVCVCVYECKFVYLYSSIPDFCKCVCVCVCVCACVYSYGIPDYFRDRARIYTIICICTLSFAHI
jgi:hypothetical protein